jgi:glycerophosphoryl diester phosphodiesterase
MPSMLTKYALVLLFLVTWSCEKVTPEVEPIQIAISAKDSARVEELITFSVENAIPGVEYMWDFGDGTSSAGKTVVHEYEQPDYYTVSVADPSNAISEAKKIIRVSFNPIIEGRLSFSDWLSDSKSFPMVCAHRGVHNSVPENSLAGIQAAIENDIPIVEIDIRQTKDSELVLMHDATIDRTSNGTGLVSNMTVEELQSFYLKKPNGSISLEIIPTLKDVFILNRGKVYFDLDIDKKAIYSKVEDLVDLYGMSEQVFYYSSESNVIDDILRDGGVAMPILKSQQDIDLYEVRDVMLVHLNSTTVEQAYLTQVKANDWKTFKNAYVNSSNSPAKDNYNELKILVEAGIDLVQTDYPVALKTYLENK